MISRTIILALVLVMFGSLVYAADCNNGGRYEDMGDGTVQDCRTGLIWLNDANCLNSFNGIDKSGAVINWYDTLKWVAGLSDTGNPATSCGLSDGSTAGDWRLPTRTEWMAMVANAKKQGFVNPALTDGTGTLHWTSGNVFLNVQTQGSPYWTSNTFALDETSAWAIWAYDGSTIQLPGDKFFPAYVWPVRGGQSGEFGNVTIQ